MGIDAVALAGIHHSALVALAAGDHDSRSRLEPAVLAATFLAEALVPLTAARRSAGGKPAGEGSGEDSVDRDSPEPSAERRRAARQTERWEAAQEALAESEDRNRALVRHSDDMQEELRLLTRRLLSTQEEERRRISRELHDALGQVLTRIHLQLVALDLEARAAPKSLRVGIASTSRLVRKSMKTVHRFAMDLRSEHLEDLGLVPALRSLLRDFSWGEGVRLRFRATGEFTDLGSDPSTALFRVAQEALTNVHRHAGAENVRVTLERLPDTVRMTVWNDGRAFDVERRTRSQANRHLGLLCMRERMEMVGGTISIQSSPEGGTTVRTEVPLAGNADA